MQIKRNPEPHPANYSVLNFSRGRTAIVSHGDKERLSRYSFRLKRSAHCWYVVTRATYATGYKEIPLHRLIMSTPPGQVCHHINHNTLDNRRENLVNLDPIEHRELHNLTLKSYTHIEHNSASQYMQPPIAFVSVQNSDNQI